MRFTGFKIFIQIRQGLKLAKENNNRFKREKGQKFPLVHGIMLFWPPLDLGVALQWCGWCKYTINIWDIATTQVTLWGKF